MSEDGSRRGNSLAPCGETPGGESPSSTYGSCTNTYTLSQQRSHARHARDLPSRNLALLPQAKKKKYGNVTANIAYKTIRVSSGDDGVDLPVEEHARNIVSHMELDEDLMRNDFVSEMRRLETLREMPQSLTVKRSIRAKLAVSVSRKWKKKQKKSLGYWKSLKYAASISLTKIGITMKRVSCRMELWRGAIRKVEGHFGSGVATYFKFLRWLFIVNTMSCLLSTCLVTVPQALVRVSNHEARFDAWDIIVGNGFLQDTILYYGFYSNETIELGHGYAYDIPSAYFFTLAACYVSTFALLSVKVARWYRECYIETAAGGGGIGNVYASKIFSGWDFGVSSRKAANSCSASIHRELEELLAEAKVAEDGPSLLDSIRAFFYQIGITIAVMSSMAAIGFSLWTLVVSHDDATRHPRSDPWSLLLVPFVITAIMNVFPLVASFLVKFERYKKKRTALYVTMIRVYVMSAIAISTVVVYRLSWRRRHTTRTADCWQTDFAREIYKLLVVDFIVSIVGNFIVQAIRCRLHRRWGGRKVSPPKFQIASDTLNLIYNEMLFWIGFYFSPPMSILIVAKMLLTFYIKKYGLTRDCEPPSTSWRAAQTQTLFLALAFISITAIIFVLGYVVTSLESRGCGPFRNHDYTWRAVVDGLLNLPRDAALRRLATSLAKPGIGAALLLAMSTIVYCLRARAEASKRLVRILGEMLVLQSRDKEFLLKELSKVADAKIG